MNAKHHVSFLHKAFTATMTVVLLSAILVSTVFADTAGPSFPGTGANVNGPGTINWTNPGNVVSNNNVYATANVNGATSEYLQAINYGFSIPLAATINGITVTIGRYGSTGMGNDVRDSVVSLVKGGVITGNNLAATTTDWPGTEAAATYGGTASLWGTTWTPAEINAANFGVVLSATSTNNRTAYVDYIQITVTYTLPATTTTVASDTNPALAGQTITFTATVTGPGGTPTGTVTFRDGATTIGTGTLTAGVATFSTNTLSGGSHNITAVYGGDANYSGSTSLILTQIVNAAPAITSANATTFVVGSAGSFTVTATGYPTAFTYNISGDPLPTGVNFNTTTGVLSGTPTAGTSGVYNLIFTVGNGIAPNATQNFTLTVNQAPVFTSANNTTFTVGAAGTFTVTTTGRPTPNLSLTGGTLPNGVTFVNNGNGTATLSGTPAAGTGGQYNLTFTAANGVNPNATQNFTLYVNQAPVITSANTVTFSVGAAGTFTATATGYPTPTWSIGGDTLPSGVTFNTTTHVLSGTPASGTVGTYNITLTVTNAAGTNTQNFTLIVQKGNQTITFPQPASPQTYGTTFTINPTASSGLPVTVAATGVCTLNGNQVTMTSGTGVCTLTASQAGDASYNAAPNVVRNVNAARAATNTTITSSANPSVLGQMVTFTVRVTSSTTGTPTGTVTLSYCEWLIAFCISPTQTLGTAPLVGGIATFNIDTLPVGRNGAYIIPDRITATYNGDANFAGDSGTLDQTVNTANTITALTSSINPSYIGQSVTFTATVAVAPPGAGQVAGGTCSFYDGAVQIGTGTVNASGVATFTTSALTFGSHNITAYFQGTDDFGTSTSPILIQMVRRTTTTALTSDLNPSIYGQMVTFTATVTGPGGTPSGTVSFYNGAILLGTSTLSGGTTTFNTDALVVGSHDITAVYNGDPDFVPSTSPIVTQVVNQATLAVTADPKTITYGDSDPAFTFQYSGFLLGDDAADIDIAPICSAPTPHINAGTYAGIIECSGASDDNYTFSYVNGTLTVDPKSLTITADNQGKTYGFTLTFTGTEFTTTGLIFSDMVNSVTLTSAGALAGAPTGTYPIVPSAAVGSGLSNYDITYVNGTLTVGGNILVITANDQVKTYGQVITFAGTEFTYTLPGGGSLQPGENITSVTLASAGAGANAPVGTYTIVPSNAVGTGLSNYVIIYRSGQMDVNQATLTFDPDSHSKLYGETFTGYTGSFTGLFPFDNTVTPVYDSAGAVATATVGDYPITVTFNDPDDRLRNYVLTVDPDPAATLTVLPHTLTVTPANRSKVYGDVLTSADFTGTITGIQNGDNITATYDSPLGDPSTATVGGYDIIATISDPDNMLGNYTLVNNVGTLTVTQRDLEITSDSQTKIYGSLFSAFTGSVDGLQNSDVITPTYASTGAPETAPVGTYDITVTPLNDPGNILSNYHVIYHIGTLTVTRRDLVVTPDNQTKLYGDTFTAFTGTVTGIQNGDNITPVYSSPGAIATAAVGDYPITVTLSDPDGKLGNYNFTLNTATLTVNKRALIVTPDDKTKIYGTWFLAFTGTIAGIQNGDNITANYASPAGSPPSATVGSYPIVASLNDPTGKLGNYDITLNTGTLVVTAAELTVRADNKTIFYGDPDPALTFLYLGFVSGDTPSVIDTPPTCSVVEDPHTAVGIYTIRCSGGADDNYSFAYADGTLAIQPRSLVVTPADKIKTYGVDFTAFTGTITGLQFGDNITATYSSPGAIATAPVGDYIITPALVDPDGKQGNYTITLNNGTLTVIGRDLVVTPDNQTKVYGDNFTAFTGTITGIQNSDPITATYASPGAAPAATVAGSPYTITAALNDPGNFLPNYNVVVHTGTLTVTRRSLIVTPDNQTKEFGTTFTAFTGTISGIQNNDNITATYDSPGAISTAPVGAYQITATLNDPDAKLPNYAVTLNTGTLTVGDTILTVTANDQTKIYGDPDPNFTFTYSGFQGNDGPSDLTVQPTCQVLPAHDNIGSYPITCSGGADENYTFRYVSATLDVTARALTVTPANQTKVYGDTFTAFTGTVVGIQSGDNITVTYSSPGADATAPVSGSPYTITAALSDPNNRLGNYIVTLNTGTLTVTRRPLVVTPDNKNKVYGTFFNAFTGNMVGIQNGDNITVTYSSTGSPATAAVGTYYIVAALADPDGKLPNYAVTLNTGMLTVTRQDLVVTPDNKTKTYGDVFAAFTGTVSGIQNGDPITVTYASAGAPAAATVAGSPYTITATLNDPAGVLANYNVTLNTGTLTVLQRPLIVIPADKIKVYGTVFTAFTGNVVGIQAGDAITVSYSSAGTPASAVVNTYPIIATLNDPGGKLPNYAVTLFEGVLTVTPASTTTAITSDVNPAALNQAITFTITVSSSSGIPTGNVTLFDGAVSLGTFGLTNGTATYNTSTLALGLHTITAAYSGDANFSGNTSAPYIQGVGLSPTATVVTSNINPSNYGQLVTFTATVTSPTGIPTGNVAFWDGVVAIGTSTLDATGQVTLSTSSLIAGSHSIAAIYAGTTQFATSTSPIYTQQVNQLQGTVNLANLNQIYDGLSKSVNVTTVPPGLMVNVTYNGSPVAPTNVGNYAVVATINDVNYYGTATGTLIVSPATAPVTLSNLNQVYDGTPKAVTVTTVPPGLTVDVTYNGFPTLPINAGSYAVVATINDANYVGSTSGTLVIAGADTTVTTEIHDASEVVVTSAFAGTLVHPMATVTGVGAIPTGTVTFTAYNNYDCSGTGNAAGTENLNNGVAHLLVSTALTNSGLSFKALYSGDSNYNAGTGACTTLNPYPQVLLNASGTNPKDGNTVAAKISMLGIEFNRDVVNDGTPGAVNFTGNYLLVEDGGDKIFQTSSCKTGQAGDDTKIGVDIVNYSNNTGKGPFVATLLVNSNAALPLGTYRLFVCGTTSITDSLGNKLNNGLNDTSITFTIVEEPSAQSSLIPVTGFAPGVTTPLQVQPVDEAYVDLGTLWLEIPSLNVQSSIVGIPKKNGTWDVSWLWNQTGYLDGSAYPTASGNSVLTAHVYLSNGKPGPFLNLGTLKWGDQIIIHNAGKQYIYEVRTVTQVKPDAVSTMLKHQDAAWVTLVTCKGYDQTTGKYQYRILVSAVLINVK